MHVTRRVREKEPLERDPQPGGLMQTWIRMCARDVPRGPVQCWAPPSTRNWREVPTWVPKSTVGGAHLGIYPWSEISLVLQGVLELCLLVSRAL